MAICQLLCDREDQIRLKCVLLMLNKAYKTFFKLWTDVPS